MFNPQRDGSEEWVAVGVAGAEDDGFDIAFRAAVGESCGPLLVGEEFGKGGMLADVGFVGVVWGFLGLGDEERVFAYVSDLVNEVCG